jgi:hypothetical protein
MLRIIYGLLAARVTFSKAVRPTGLIPLPGVASVCSIHGNSGGGGTFAGARTVC